MSFGTPPTIYTEDGANDTSVAPKPINATQGNGEAMADMTFEVKFIGTELKGMRGDGTEYSTDLPTLELGAARRIPFANDGNSGYTNDANLSFDTSKRLQVATVVEFGIQRISDNSAILATTSLAIINSTGGARTNALPAYASCPDGFEVTVKRIGANTVDITTDATNAFDDNTVATPYALAASGVAVTFKFVATPTPTWIIK